MTDAPSSPVQAVVERVSDLCASAFAAVEGLRGVATQLFQPCGSDTPLHRRDLAPMADVVAPVLRTPGTPLVGAGLVVAPGILADAEHWMEWWTRRPGAGEVGRLDPALDPGRDDFYDYTVLPWFVVPARTGRAHVTGPYVDWLCTDEYTLTFTAPLFATHPRLGRRYLGVVGADVVNSWIERRLLPLLHREPAPAAVVNREGRVLVANDPGLATGSVVHDVDVPALWTGPASPGARLHPVVDLPLAVLVLDRARAGAPGR